MDNRELQELVLKLLPMWQFRLAKPFKSLLHDGISPNVYNCMTVLKNEGAPMSMGQLGAAMHMTKQQMTKLVNRLIELGMVTRVGDESDRRIVRIYLTEEANSYIERFALQQTSYYDRLFSEMAEADRKSLGDALETLYAVLENIPCNCKEKEESE